MYSGFRAIIKSAVFLTMISSLYISSLEAQAGRLKFENIGIEQGLSQNTVFCLIQDSEGFMWFGTEAGVNRYDGYTFEIYNPEPNNQNSLSNNYIYSLCEDHQGSIWVGTDGGLNKFIRKKDHFKRYFFDPSDPKSISGNRVFAVSIDRNGNLWIGTENGLNRYVRESNSFIRFKHDPENNESLSFNDIRTLFSDAEGNLWVGTYGGGLNRFDPDKEVFTHFQFDPHNPASLSDDHVLVVYEDRSGELWVGTENGLNRFDQTNSRFIHYRHRHEDATSISDNRINVIFEDNSGLLWIGTHDGGLNQFDKESQKFIFYTFDAHNPDSLKSDRIFSIVEDRSGVLWVGTYGGGISKSNRMSERFTHYYSDTEDSSSLSHNFVRSFWEDSSGIIWLGTDGGGLNKLDRNTGEFEFYRYRPGSTDSLSNDKVFSICEDIQGNLWIGTYGGGICRFDSKTERFKVFRHDPENPQSLSNDQIRVIKRRWNDTLWIGTDGGGVNKFDIKTGLFTRYQHVPDNPASLSHNRVFSVYEDMKGRIWIGTFGGGLNLLDQEGKNFKHYRDDPGNPNSIGNDYIMSIYQDADGIFWIGSNGGGLCRFDEDKGSFNHFRTQHGLADNAIYGILEDNQGNLWMSSNRGLTKFNKKTHTSKIYDRSDGLQSNEFNGGSYYKSPKGEMFFGGINGFNSFFPEKIQDNPHIPPVVLTDFQLFNKSVAIGEKVNGETILPQSIAQTEEIVLNYRQDVFSFEFAALHYALPEKNEYAFMMEGFDKDWRSTDSQKRFAYYTNLDPGNYTFRVKASNNDGVWNEEGTSVKIRITPPFWETTWFRGLGIFVILLSTFSLHQVRTGRIRRRNKELEKHVEERTAELEEVNKELTDFAHVVSHDLKAPLRAVNQLTAWLADDYADKFDENGKEQLNLLLSRVKRMQNLIDGILQYSRAGRKEEQIESINLNKLMAEIIDNLSPPGHIKIFVEDNLPTIHVERIRIQQVFQNLLSNAIKYMDKPQGEIKVSCKEENYQWVFAVSDNGPGIEKKYYGTIFNIFQTLESKDKHESTGVGLSVVNKIVNRFGGKVWVESTVGRGSTFYFTFPKTY
ncbi:MAG: GHKL domain-containing protein [Candidatus Aminicenantes bacterium]|nr:GHKL domain-containing protein [Candidatus Aminicenantes bacterium]